MPTPVLLPALGESVTEGTISRWLKKVGDRVEIDEPLVEVSTDKVDTEIPSPVSGVVLEILVAEDGVAAVGAVLAMIGEETPGVAAVPAEPAPAAEPEPASTTPEPAQEMSEHEPVAPVSQPAPVDQSPPASGTTEVLLPQLGESVTEGTISRWLKKVGDHVEAEEPLVEISTDKVDTELPSPAAGTLLQIRVEEDQTAAVGSVLAVIGSATNLSPQAPVSAPPAPQPPVVTAPATPPVAATPPAPQLAAPPAPAIPAETPEARRAAPPAAADVGYVTPLVRKLAQSHGVDLSKVSGTGVGGRIRKQDVIAAAEAAKAPASSVEPAQPNPMSAPGPDDGKRGTTEKMSRLRATIARRMVESLQVSAQLTATVEVDLTAISKLRERVKDDFRAREGVGLSYLPFITKAATEALKQFPKVNATIDTEAGTITYADAEHVGIAVDTEKGLLVPVVRDAGDLTVTALAKKISDLAARTRSSKVTPDELSGGTFTITNYGSAGTLMDTPIINQPQVAILGTGALVKRPVVVEDPNLGEIVAVRDMMYLSLSYDHRLVDGADAARFLSFLKARLEAGDFEL